jgi:hypothetical protein
MHARIDVLVDGSVNIVGAGIGTDFVSLDGISFLSADATPINVGGGVVADQTMDGALGYNLVDIPIADEAWSTITFTGVEWEVGSVSLDAASGTFTVLDEGIYNLATFISVSTASTEFRILYRVANVGESFGVDETLWIARDYATAGLEGVTGSIPVKLLANQQLQVRVFSNGATNVRGAVRSWVSLVKMSGLSAPRIIESTYTFRTITGTTHTFEASDLGKIVQADNVSPSIFTVPPAADVQFPVGGAIRLRVKPTAGNLTIAAGAGVTINTAESLELNGTNAGAELIYEGSDNWWLVGRLVSA